MQNDKNVEERSRGQKWEEGEILIHFSGSHFSSKNKASSLLYVQ